MKIEVKKNTSGYIIANLKKSLEEAKAEYQELEDTHNEIQHKYDKWQNDHKSLIELNERLAQVNAKSADLMAELEEKNQALRELNDRLAKANASSAELMVELEEKNGILMKTNQELARANAHAAELMAIIELKDEEIQNLNRSLSKVNARSADLIAEREIRMEELRNLNRKLKKEITVRKKAEAEITASESRFRTIFESSPLGIAIIDPRTLRFIDANPAYYNMLEYSRNELLSVTFGKITHPKDLQKNLDSIRLIVTGKTINFSLEKRNITKSDKVVWVTTTGTTISDLENRHLYTLVIEENITDRKLAEAEREKLITELQDALSRVKTLSGLLPICASCKKIRDDQGYWSQVEEYLCKHSEAIFSHGICPDCMKTAMADLKRLRAKKSRAGR